MRRQDRLGLGARAPSTSPGGGSRATRGAPHARGGTARSLAPPEGLPWDRTVRRPHRTLAVGMNRPGRFIPRDDRPGTAPAVHKKNAARPSRRPSSAGTTIGFEHGNERTDVPQQPPPPSGLAPVRGLGRRRPRRWPRRRLAGVGAAPGLRPPLRLLGGPGGRHCAVRAQLGLARETRGPDDPRRRSVVRVPPHAPTRLPPPGPHDSVLLHRRGRPRAVAGDRPTPRRLRALGRDVHRGRGVSNGSWSSRRR